MLFLESEIDRTTTSSAASDVNRGEFAKDSFVFPRVICRTENANTADHDASTGTTTDTESRSDDDEKDPTAYLQGMGSELVTVLKLHYSFS